MPYFKVTFRDKSRNGRNEETVHETSAAIPRSEKENDLLLDEIRRSIGTNTGREGPAHIEVVSWRCGDAGWPTPEQAKDLADRMAADSAKAAAQQKAALRVELPTAEQVDKANQSQLLIAVSKIHESGRPALIDALGPVNADSKVDDLRDAVKRAIVVNDKA